MCGTKHLGRGGGSKWIYYDCLQQGHRTRVYLMSINAVNYREPIHSVVVIWVKKNQTQLMVEIYFKSLVKIELKHKFIETNKSDEKCPLFVFVNKQLFWWSASITSDTKNDVVTNF